METRWSGCGTALVTPFTETGALDETAVTRLARRQVENGVHFLVPCGTTGESPTLSHREKLTVVELVVKEAAGRVPVLAGAGGYETEGVVALARDMVSSGADFTVQGEIVPEPGTLSLAALGLVGLAAGRRLLHRRRAA